MTGPKHRPVGKGVQGSSYCFQFLLVLYLVAAYAVLLRFHFVSHVLHLVCIDEVMYVWFPAEMAAEIRNSQQNRINIRLQDPRTFGTQTFRDRKTKHSKFADKNLLQGFLIFVHMHHHVEHSLRRAYNAHLHTGLSTLLPPLSILTSAIIYFCGFANTLREMPKTNRDRAIEVLSPTFLLLFTISTSPKCDLYINKSSDLNGNSTLRISQQCADASYTPLNSLAPYIKP